MSATIFVDTNVLVYVRDPAEPEKQRRAAEWMARLWESRAGRLSEQVLHEYYVTATRKLGAARPREDVREDVLALAAWRPIAVDVQVIERAWGIEDRFGFSYRDALIAAAAGSGRCRYLLTEDLQDGQEIDGVTVINPFAHEPSRILRN